MRSVIDVRQFKDHIKADAQSVTISFPLGEQNLKQNIKLEYRNVGFGKRRFMVCPICSKRAKQFYLHNDLWVCRGCSGVNPYQGIQNNTKGGYDEIAYRMIRYAKQNDITFDFPFDYLKFIFDPRNKKKKFRDSIKVMQALENMRSHSLFFNATYSPKVIKSVTSGQHLLLKTKTLKDLKDKFYNWNTGNEIVLLRKKRYSDISDTLKKGKAGEKYEN